MKMFHVDAFTDGPFSGNPAAVCVLEREASSEWMQNVAAEMNLSETAFVRPVGNAWELRWFTPATEVDLCGHATLATAHVLWSHTQQSADRLLFDTRSGRLSARRDADWIVLDFPATPASPAQAPPELLSALGVRAQFVGQSKFDWLIEVKGEDELRSMAPDFGKLARVPVRGVIATCRGASNDCDFLSRFFAPAVGINEDPVTGSAHCCLAPFWQAKLGKSELVARQASARGGLLRLSVRGDRVELGGRAVTVLAGELLV